MKIKLQEYSLISNELLDEIDELLSYFEDITKGREGDKITILRGKLLELTSSEKLAKKCYQDIIKTISSNIVPDYSNYIQSLLNSEIEI